MKSMKEWVEDLKSEYQQPVQITMTAGQLTVLFDLAGFALYHLHARVPSEVYAATKRRWVECAESARECLTATPLTSEWLRQLRASVLSSEPGLMRDPLTLINWKELGVKGRARPGAPFVPGILLPQEED